MSSRKLKDLDFWWIRRRRLSSATDMAATPSSLHSLGMSFFIILVSEIGDKTFLIAAVLAMTHSRLLIFSAAMTALFIMTVLSATVGNMLKDIISRQYTEVLSAVLFLVFGTTLMRDALKMTGTECQEELEQVTLELDSTAHDNKDMEEGTVSASTSLSCNYCIPVQRLLPAVWVQAFVMTFVAEWGDRSQIATVALAGSQNFWWVTIGGLMGHAVCSCIAVIGGRLVKRS